MAESLTDPLSGDLVLQLPDPAATAQLGAALAAALLAVAPAVLIVHLHGDLGAGKTALVRSILPGLDHQGRVPSPTYTLVEPYQLPRFRVLHVDLYRLRDPAELDDLGLGDELGSPDAAGRGRLLFAEWPQRGEGRLPPPDLVVTLSVSGDGRKAQLAGRTPAGMAVAREVRRAFPAGF